MTEEPALAVFAFARAEEIIDWLYERGLNRSWVELFVDGSGKFAMPLDPRPANLDAILKELSTLARSERFFVPAEDNSDMPATLEVCLGLRWNAAQAPPLSERAAKGYHTLVWLEQRGVAGSSIELSKRVLTLVIPSQDSPPLEQQLVLRELQERLKTSAATWSYCSEHEEIRVPLA